MTEREVEVEKTVTDKETVSLCDDCGLETTPDTGVTYRGGPDVPPLHLHYDCIENVTLADEFDHTQIRKGPTVRSESKFPIIFALDGFDTALVFIGSLFIGAGFVLPLSNSLVVGFVIAIIGALLLWAGLGFGRSQARETVPELIERSKRERFGGRF